MGREPALYQDEDREHGERESLGDTRARDFPELWRHEEEVDDSNSPDDFRPHDLKITRLLDTQCLIRVSMSGRQ